MAFDAQWTFDLVKWGTSEWKDSLSLALEHVLVSSLLLSINVFVQGHSRFTSSLGFGLFNFCRPHSYVRKTPYPAVLQVWSKSLRHSDTCLDTLYQENVSDTDFNSCGAVSVSTIFFPSPVWDQNGEALIQFHCLRVMSRLTLSLTNHTLSPLAHVIIWRNSLTAPHQK